MEIIKLKLLLNLSIFMLSMLVSSSAQKCSSYTFSRNQIFSACNDLPYLNSFLHWNYNSSSKKIQIAYRQKGVSSSNWVAWAINPSSKGMVGSQALIAYPKSDGTVKAYTSPITTYQTSLKQGKLSFDVSDLSATYANNEIIIFATLGLSNIIASSNTINQVWQKGPVSGDSPQMHPTAGPNVQSTGTVNLLSGAVGAAQGDDKIRKRNIHGVLNAVSWGIMMPIGGIIARYMKVFKSADPAWFYLHVSCQTMAYVVGVGGWGTGIKLGSDSSGVQYDAHRTIGIILFCLGTLQVLALLVRPKPDHKYRLYWNIYHHTVGYVVIILSIINIFKGFHILNPQNKWKNAYIGVIAALGFVAVWLEGYSWYLMIKKKKNQESSGKMPQAINGSNGYNGSSRHHQVV